MAFFYHCSASLFPQPPSLFFNKVTRFAIEAPRVVFLLSLKMVLLGWNRMSLDGFLSGVIRRLFQAMVIFGDFPVLCDKEKIRSVCLKFGFQISFSLFLGTNKIGWNWIKCQYSFRMCVIWDKSIGSPSIYLRCEKVW